MPKNLFQGEDDYRGGSGPLYVSRGSYGNVLHKVFIEAGQQAGGRLFTLAFLENDVTQCGLTAFKLKIKATYYTSAIFGEV